MTAAPLIEERGAAPHAGARGWPRALPMLLVAAACCAYLLSFPLAIGRADESHALFEARRVFDGEVPYRDFFESLTPLSLYFFAAAYWLGGTTLLAARVAIALVAGLGCALLFDLVRRAAGAAEAVLAVLIVACLALPVWPYASPHWISTTLGLLTATAVLGGPWDGGWRRPLLAGALAGAAICVQQQRGVFIALWLPPAWLLLGALLPPARRRRAVLGAIAASVAGALLVVVPLLGHAAWRASLASMLDMLFGFALKHYGPANSGSTPWAAVLLLTNSHAAATWLWLLRLAPLLVLGEGVLAARALWRAPQPRAVQRAALWLLALLMGLSICYLPDFIHVTFVLPFLIIPAASLLHRLRATPRLAATPALRLAVLVALLLFGAALARQGAVNLRAARAAAPQRFASAGFGTLDGDAGLERLYRAVARHLVREADGRALLYSYPNDAWLYLALPADNVTPYSLLAANMFPPEDFQRVIATLRARRPGTVVLWLPFASGAAGGGVPEAIAAGYDAVEEVEGFRIYVRRGAPPVPGGGA